MPGTSKTPVTPFSLSLKIDLAKLDFDLPEELIAQHPTEKRDEARLMVVSRRTGALEHKVFRDLPDYLKSGDVLILNKAQVNKAQLTGKKITGGKVTVILISQFARPDTWKALIRPQLKEGTKIDFGPGISGHVLGQFPEGEYKLQIIGVEPAELMKKKGAMPLPPYIKRDYPDSLDETDYQTVYASVPGSVAAPTAGLHFTSHLIQRIQNKGVECVELLLNVGWGTFRPISKDVASHEMLAETYEISGEAMATLQKAKKEGRRIVAVGTTSTRVIESLSRNLPSETIKGETRLFIKPDFSFQWVDALITNFHVPRSTPVSLTAAFLGLSRLEQAYDEAIKERYRFFSYGDAMLIQ